MPSSLSRRAFLQLSAYAAALPAFSQPESMLPADSPGGLRPIYLKDMDQCLPAGALSHEPQRHHWRLLPYETEQFAGTMLVAGQNTAAPEIRLPVPYKGWHAISFGIRSWGAPEDPTRLQVKLDSDSTFSLISHTGGRADRIDNYFWKAAHLDNNEIVLRQLFLQRVPESADSPGNSANGVWLAYVELRPLSETEVRGLQSDRRSGKNRKLFAHNDAWSYTFEFRPTEEADIRRELEPFRDTDFSRIYWEAGAGDRMLYPTRLGLTPVDDQVDDLYRVGDRLAAETWRSWRARGIDPLRTALEYAHSIGLELHATYRVAGFHFPPPEEIWNKGGLYDRHPEWRGTDRDGRRTPRLSYAYPEVRHKVTELLTEMASYPVDGICLAYNRIPPLVEFAPPVVNSFQAKYGVSPRSLDDRDPRWLSHRAGVLTNFMREVRAALSQAAAQQRRSRPIALTAIVMGTEEENLYNAIDLRTWAREGLVDTIIPYTSGPGLNSSIDSWLDPKQVKFFIEITQGTQVKFAPNLMPRQLTPEEYRRRANMLYDAGVENLFFWDTNARNNFSPSWTTLARLGHREEIEAWVQKGSSPIERPGQKMLKLGDWDLRYVGPW